MSNILDLEQRILDCWGICEDIKVLNSAVLEQDISRDSISNVLIGLQELYSLKFDQLFRTFEKVATENIRA